MMNDSEMLDGTLSKDVVVHTSLAISPDLNALLEHDERTRGPHQPDASSPHFWQSPHSGSSNSTFPVGLPPPPRGNRKAVSRPATPKEPESIGTRSKLWSEATEPLPESSDSSPLLTNPFINAPPQLHHPYRSNVREQSNSAVPQFSGTFETLDSLPKTLDRVVDPADPDLPRDLLHPVGSYIPSVSGAQEGSASPRPTDQPTFRTHSVPRVEKLIGRGKSMFSISGSQPQDNTRAISGEDESDSSGMSSLLDRGRPRNFSELSLQPGPTKHEKYKNGNQSQKHSKSSTKKGGLKAIPPPMTDSSQPSSPRSPEELNTSKRPTVSHWSHSWEPSRTRSGSLTSESTQSPTTEPRISISSTRYSPSYPESSYRSDSPANRNSLSFASPERDSFIDLYLPSSPKFATILERSPTSPPSISTPSHSSATFRSFSNDRSPLSPHFPNPSTASPTTHSSKPPIPTTPKPSFKQFSSVHPPTDRKQRGISPGPFHRLSHQPSPKAAEESHEPVPPTTNFLNADERADLVKKNRKLAQVFGTTPGAVAILQKHDGLQPDSAVFPSLLPRGTGKGRHPRSVGSVSGVLKPPAPIKDSNPWPLLEGTQYMTASGRRHSAPLTPDNFRDNTAGGDPHSGHIKIGSQNGLARGDSSSNQLFNHDGTDSPTSFMDLSDEDISNDAISAILYNETLQENSQRPRFPHSSSTPSLVETLTPEEQEEVERRRKRDKLAKLHRFLGSRVPVQLVLGANDGGSPTSPGPRGQEGRASKLDAVSEHEERRRAWLTRRRSSSAAVYPQRSDDLERLKEDLNDEEKAIHVRRAQKMEKVFGVPPPQTLYTRPSASLPPYFTAAPSSGTSATAQTEPSSPVGRSRNPNQTSYKGKKRHDRPGTSESTEPLLPSRGSESFSFDFQTPSSPAIPDVYTHYQHSLHSLNDIIDRDDRASLVELHQYLRGDAMSQPLQEFARTSSSASIKSERRHSLPPSIMSVSTGDSGVLTPKPGATDFQLRRRRAAKLTHFFGVDYRQIMTDILESIEKGVEEERRRGTLQAEEVEVLLCKVRTLKTKRNVIS